MEVQDGTIVEPKSCRDKSLRSLLLHYDGREGHEKRIAESIRGDRLVSHSRGVRFRAKGMGLKPIWIILKRVLVLADGFFRIFPAEFPG